MIELFGWTVMALVIWSVVEFSAGRTTNGNCLTAFATLLGMIYFSSTSQTSFFILHAILFTRSAYMLYKRAV